MKQYGGFKYPEISEKDYIAGTLRSSQGDEVNPSGDWTKDTPIEELQRTNVEDTNGCTNFGATNQVETYLKRVFSVDSNLSERFLAVVSEQTRNGNDPQKVYEAIRKFGLLPEEDLPLLDNMSFDEYLSPVPMTQPLLKTAEEFLDYYDFEHEYVFHPYDFSIPRADKTKLILADLKRSPIGASVCAWFVDKDGIYFRPEGMRNNHWTLIVGGDEKYATVFDSYPPYIKRLTWDHFDVAKTIWIGKKSKKKEPEVKENWFVRLVRALIKKIFNL